MLDDLILCATALVAGAQNSIAGGGTLYTFPTLLRVLTDSRVANGTSTAALVPGSVAGAWGYASEVRQTPRSTLILLMVPSLLGAAAGTLLVVNFPESYFKTMVPWLILTAATLFLIQPQIAKFTKSHAVEHRPSAWVQAGVIFFQFLVAVYGGYFGAGIGILMLTSLSLMGLGDIHRVNALKTVLASGINAVSVAIFIAHDMVRWHFALPMAAAAIVGGYLGARLARRMNKTMVRWLVIVIGFGLAAYYFIRQ
ncbi:MAG: sulfite exporter TauE/SafE family protein [Gemmataceae bacterium]